MHNDHDTKSGGASIKPSARPSIHSHRGGCVFKSGEIENMGRYGLSSDKDQRTPIRHNTSSNDEGIDEPDNIISKPLRPSPFSNRTTQRRNSFSPPATPDDDLSISRHAQSLPTKFNLRSYSSEEFDILPNPRDYLSIHEQNSTDDFRAKLDHFNNSSASTSQINEQLETSIRKRTPRQRYTDNNKASHTSFGKYVPESVPLNQSRQNQEAVFPKTYFGFILLLIVGIGVCYMTFSDYIDIFGTPQQYSTENFNSDLNVIAQKYKMDDDSVLQLQAGLSTIVQRQDTGSFIFAYKSNSRDFDQENLNNLIDSIASTASRYLRNDTVRHIVVDGSKLRMSTHSELINKYRGDIAKTGVMLVKEIDEVPSSLAMAFHYYCDELNPLVKKSAIIFTLDMTKCSLNPAEQKANHFYIENCLKKKWSGVPKDNISPLLNRVVSTIIDVATD